MAAQCYITLNSFTVRPQADGTVMVYKPNTRQTTRLIFHGLTFLAWSALFYLAYTDWGTHHRQVELVVNPFLAICALITCWEDVRRMYLQEVWHFGPHRFEVRKRWQFQQEWQTEVYDAASLSLTCSSYVVSRNPVEARCWTLQVQPPGKKWIRKRHRMKVFKWTWSQAKDLAATLKAATGWPCWLSGDAAVPAGAIAQM
jgi:hypothetical protein